MKLFDSINMKHAKMTVFIMLALGVFLLPGISEAAGEQLSGDDMVKEFINLKLSGILFLFILGFLGGLISGFIGSGGAFVLTPGIMSLGVPAAIAVASNMCHKFPKALVGAYKRFKYGQVDLKLGLIMAVTATIGVQLGIRVQKFIFAKWGAAGSNLYVSLAFVSVLTVLGIYMLYDARKSMRPENRTGGVKKDSLADKIARINIPPMIYLKTANRRVSLWVTMPVGLCTGLLAATIAVGGFIGVPGMIYIIGAPAMIASATELVVAFVMGMSGTINWAMGGFVDIRLALLILAGSLIGVQLGAVGTTYVKEHMIKLVMATIMLIVSVSRGFAIPGYLTELGTIQMNSATIHTLNNVSFVTMCFALAMGGVIILVNMIKARREIQRQEEASEVVQQSLQHN
ncbi:sulfite exporter TauE/SafE family protein [Desulfallas thermosapovorans]|uniref:Probable membrane transporter protein n=1 Tax=Desulfallas thermosapovorans DSM 6562 TaxID=1121431 RepID=A0A5S4ZNB4_9FIRM|nr:sulfite exporter TauE/SafE family protein [Desulfallas thermosapovorans]TYO92315.1 hypothetical protein LX24_02909 [Desulfallas thermosapovorans DSM 6562]